MVANLFGLKMEFEPRDKQGFFDRPDVIARFGRGKHRAMHKAAATCRKKIQQGVRRATNNKPSKPGKPPKQRMAGDEGLRKIFYSLNFQTDTVRISVLKYNRSFNAPALHEFGGMMPKDISELGPTRDTQWIFDPATLARNASLRNQLEFWQRQSYRRDLRIRTAKREYGIESFTETRKTVLAKYPKRSYMQSGVDKYQRSQHFQRQLQEMLKG